MEISGFTLNSKVLFDRIEEIKKNPPPEIVAYLKEHPEFKATNCALLAAYIGISEKTLTNLKLGKLPDSNCSTVKMICTALKLDIRDYFGMPRQMECNPEKCTSHAQARLEEKLQRITELEALYNDADKRLVNLRTIIKDQSVELGSANAKVEVLERLISEKDNRISVGGKGIHTRNVIICVLGIALVIMIALAIYFLWEAMHPYQGNFTV